MSRLMSSPRRSAFSRLGATMLAALALMSGAVSAAPQAAGRSHVWLVGGGPDPDGSQGQIELNVLWVADIVRSVAPGATLKVYFADASPEVRDVRIWSRPADSRENLQPLARIFGQQEFNGNQYRKHRVPDIVHGTRADLLAPSLAREFGAMGPQDRGLFVFNGHGLRDLSDRAGNTLRLWDDTRMSVRELERLATNAPPSAPLRFVFTQCYSGGFMRLIRPDARDLRTLAAYNRCGFAAESADRLSEGCSASIEVGDYRDYTTYFFAALSGRHRSGQPLERSPDRDRDGQVTLHEAHVHAVIEGYNADLPRSTSETYLERWQPAWLRYLDTTSEPDNEYGRLASELALRLKLPARGTMLQRALGTRHEQLGRRLQAIDEQSRQLEGEISRLQGDLKRGLVQRWPEAAHAHTAAYVRFLATELGAAQAYVTARPDYAQLVERQERHAALELERVAVDRDLTQLDKVLRLRQLSRLLDQFERFATPSARREYQRLIRCERTPL